MKQFISLLLVFVIVFTVLFVIPRNITFDSKYILRVLQTLAKEPVPSLTGGNDFSGDFVEGSAAVAYLISYPIRIIYYLLDRIITFFDIIFNYQKYHYFYDY